MGQGYFSLVLHAHLPYVRHPEHDSFLEEDWLFEAITETYIPLLLMFETLEGEAIPFRLTLTLSPTLLSMLTDELLLQRYENHLKNLILLAEKEIERTHHHPELRPLALMYSSHFKKCLNYFSSSAERNIISRFKYFQDEGFLEIITCGATHGFFPLLDSSPNAVKAQVRVAMDDYERLFKCRPRGIWLPECGYHPGHDYLLKEEGLEFFYLDAHGLLYGEPQPSFGVFAPIQCPSGMRAFARDLETSKLVWSKEEGYPGDPYYREFFKDIGFDLDWEYIKPFFEPNQFRKNTGIKYYRITDRKSQQKMIYDPFTAKERAKNHAEHFVSGRVSHVRSLFKEIGKKPLITSTYDAELFGHWWYEGPIWLEHVLRGMAKENCPVQLITPMEYLEENQVQQTIQPAQSSWGDKGYHEFWLNDKNDWIYKHIHEVSLRMYKLAKKYKGAKGILRKLLNQAAREVLLAQSSDWPFIMRTGTTVSYASKRVQAHIGRFNKLYVDLSNGLIDPEFLSRLEEKSPLFPMIDYEIYS